MDQISNNVIILDESWFESRFVANGTNSWLLSNVKWQTFSDGH